MALYSVWDWDRNAYRVYATKSPVSVGDDPIAPKPSGLSALGADPDQHIKPLPSGAKFMGYSHLARGEVRRMPKGLGDNGDDAGKATGLAGMPLVAFGLGAAAASLIWWWRR